MMLEKKYNTRSSQRELKCSGLEFVQKTCILGRKRVAVVSSMIEESTFASPVSTKMQKRLNHLEALPQDILVIDQISELFNVWYGFSRQVFV